ncbi:MAG: site-specific DNA-methyltransferase [Deltaproteobacteria bacterium]|nr:site-specific DNA-methyltransferase [Deltaproteobacteria bacterium]HCH66283.1 site-specific DNA-methyltransferase [Deltaproteobacteria bacterium]
MPPKHTRPQLVWSEKYTRPHTAPRTLVEQRALSHQATDDRPDAPRENLLIQGDNLLALEALEPQYAARIKCVFIDPPYNTGQTFEHYDDDVAHARWLSMMRDRLVVLHRLLAEDGSIWITIDDHEAHYLKVLADEVFGRANFIGTVVWEKADSPRMDAQFLSSRHDFVLVYSKNREHASFNPLPVTELPKHYNRRDDNGRAYYLKPLRAMGGQGETRAARPNLYFSMTAPDGTEVYPKRQDGTDGAWRWSREKVARESARIEWTRSRGRGWSPNYRIYAKTNQTRPPESIWFHTDVGSNRTSKAEVKRVLPDAAPFGTPKPEALLQRILHIATDPGDLVLDSFAGSGTTGAVAHKMGRRWILVELGAHCLTHTHPRMVRVVDGEDPGGISAAVDWRGGGGFRFFHLAPSASRSEPTGS